jgi:hypothetical protein
MLWLRSLWRPPRQPLGGDEALPVWGKLLVLGYLLGWLALGVALYAFWWEWSAPVKYSLALLEALLAPDLAGIRSAFSGSRP